VITNWAQHWREVAECAATAELAGTLTYEQMKTDQATQLHHIFESLGVESSLSTAKKCSESATFENVTGRKAGEQRHDAKARKGIAGDWKNFFTRKDAELFHSIAGESLIRYGYETNSDWINEMPHELVWNEDMSN